MLSVARARMSVSSYLDWAIVIYLNYMSLDDTSEEDCTVFIEQIKSDNLQQRLSSVQKVARIGDVLGPRRIKNELVPYLLQIVREMDNDQEFLIKLCEQVVLLRQKCGQLNHSYYLMQLLQTMACFDQPTVRQKAISCLAEFTHGQSDSFFKDRFFPLVKSLADNPNFPAKISSCSLIHVTYPRVDDSKKNQLQDIFMTLSNNDVPMVRRVAAQCLVKFGQVVPKQFSKTTLIDIWRKLVMDSFDIVRIKALDSAGLLSNFLKKQEIQDRMFNLIKGFDFGNLNWRVRYSICECLSTLSDKLDKQLVKNDLFIIFQKFLGDAQYQVKSISLFKISELSKKLGDEIIIERIFPQLVRLSKDSNHHVRQSVVECLCPVAKGLNRKQKLSELLLPIIETLVKDSALTVRISMVSKLGNICNLLGAQLTQQFVLPIVVDGKNQKKWRYRYSIVQKIPEIFEQLTMAQISDIEIILKSYLADLSCSVREKAVQAASQLLLLPNLQYIKIKNLISKSLKEMTKNPHYIFRVTAANAFKFLKESLKEKDLGDLFSAISNQLAKDKIANVKVTLLKSFVETISKLPDGCRKQFRLQISGLINDADEDVQFFAQQAKDTR